MRWPRSDFALCSPSAQRTDSEMLLFPHPFGPTMAVMPGVTFRTVFSANDLKPCSATDSRRMGFLSTGDPLRPKKKAPAVGVLPRQSAKYRPSSCLEVVTFLVLLAGAAEAGVVTPDFFPGRRARSLGARRGHGCARGLARQRAAGFTRIRPRRHRGQLHRRVAHDLHLEEPLDHGGLDAFEHLLEEVERLFLVLRQRVALAVAPQPDAFLEVVDRQQVVLPLRVQDDQHLVSLERLQEVGAEFLLPLL